jgi:hypothetical protein
MQENVENFRKLILESIPKIPKERNCSCRDVLKKAYL